MQEQGNTGSVPQVPPAARGGGLFGDKPFPGTRPPEPPPPAPEPRAAGGRRTWNIILMIGLFVAAISGLAWVAQNLPSWRSRAAPAPAVPTKGPAAKELLLEFTQVRSLWDPEDDKYAREFEKGQKGYYDFSFKNASGQALELGLIRTSCDCTKVEVAVFSPSDPSWQKYQDSKPKERLTSFPAGEGLPWKVLPVDDRKGVDVPAGHMGLVRLGWEGKTKTEGEYLRLNLLLWSQPKGQMSARQFPNVEAGVILSPVVRFIHEQAGKLNPESRVSLGTLAAREVGKVTFVSWSATRPNVKLTLTEKPDDKKPYEFTIEKLSESDGRALETRLRDAGVNTRVLSAFRIHVKVHEPLMDQGPFNTALPLAHDGERLEGGPVVTGYVRGLIQVGNSEIGRVELPTFLVKDGVPQHVVPVTAEGNIELAYESHYPAFVQVKLEKNLQESNQGRTRWYLEVRIPPHYANPGPLPTNSAVILRSSGSSSRVIRIPITGNAIQG